MNLSAKHQQSVITYGDFTGGLNTTTVPEMIAENQMADCVNMEFNRTTGALQTCCGTATVFQVPQEITIDKLFYDEINNIFLFTDSNTGAIYKSRLVDVDGTHSYDREKVGTLSGDKTPSAVMWENGLLIASGGRLQYWNGNELVSIRSENAPSKCNGVFVKNGRVYVWYDYRLQCSAVGDEEGWTDDSGDDSTSKWIDIGYKEGENEQAYITGACALSSDIVIIKNDGKVYRLAGEYPDWSLKEIARNITCINPQCYTAVQDGVFVVSREGMFLLQTTVDYGDVRPTNVASGIIGLLGILSVEKSYVEFLPARNQIWIAGYENRFICFDLTFKAFFQRKFNSAVNAICPYKDYFMLSRAHKVVELVDGIYHDEKYSDDESEMEWLVIAKSHTSFYDFLLKRIRLVYVPLLSDFTSAELVTAEGKIKIDIAEAREKASEIVADKTLIVDDNRYLFSMNTQFTTRWMVYRNRVFGMMLQGKGSAIMINKIDSAIAEV